MLSKAQPTDEQWADICFGFELAKQMGPLILVKPLLLSIRRSWQLKPLKVLDKCILRGGELGRGDAVVVKTENQIKTYALMCQQ